MSSRKVSVVGAGSWGTALAHHLKLAGHSVTIWGRDRELTAAIEKTRQNPRYFPGLELCSGIQAAPDLKQALSGADLVVFAVASSAMRDVITQAKSAIGPECLLLSTVKGLEENSLKFMTQVIADELGDPKRVAVLSGPSFAREVILRMPTAVTIASRDAAHAKDAAAAFHFENFRVYTSTDVIGVEMGGVMKNVIALAVGVLDGLGMGLNARAALMTRGLAEMMRLSVKLGADAKTVSGLSGLGDLLLTSTGDLSRNRQVGLRLGQGEKLPAILGSLGQVAEAINSSHRVLQLAKKNHVEVPIVEEVDRLLNGQSDATSCVARLLARSPASE